MVSFLRVRIGLGFLVVFGSCLCGPASAGDGTIGAPSLAADVALGPDGLLSGRVLDAQGAPTANLPVSLRSFQNQEIAAVVSDPQGRFAVRNVRGGVYQLVTPQGHGIYRLWAPGTAPPSAQQGATLVIGGDTVRGAPPEDGGANRGVLKGLLTSPLVIGGVVATAIAVPVALANSHHGGSQPASP